MDLGQCEYIIKNNYNISKNTSCFKLKLYLGMRKLIFIFINYLKNIKNLEKMVFSTHYRIKIFWLGSEWF